MQTFQMLSTATPRTGSFRLKSIFFSVLFYFLAEYLNKYQSTSFALICIYLILFYLIFNCHRKIPLHELCYQHADYRFRCLKTMCEVDPSIARKGCGAGSNRLGNNIVILLLMSFVM